MAFDQPYVPNINNALSNAAPAYALGATMRQENAMSEAGKAYAQGDQTGTVNALAEGGQLEQAAAMQNQFRAAARQADADKLAKAQRSNELLGNLALAIKAMPPEAQPHALENAIAQARKVGMEVPDEFSDPGMLDVVLARAGMVKDALDQELARRKVQGGGFKVVGKGGRVFNEQTQQFIEPPGGTADPVEGAKFEQDLRKEYAGLSKNFRSVQEGVDRVAAGAKLDNAVGDLSLIFGYMKLLDPGSVVREGEFANAENTQGVPDRVLNWYNKIRNGDRLTQRARQEFAAAAKELGKSQIERQQRIMDQFKGIAGDAGLDPDRVIMDFGPRQEPPPPAANQRPRAVNPDTGEVIEFNEQTGQWEAVE